VHGLRAALVGEVLGTFLLGALVAGYESMAIPEPRDDFWIDIGGPLIGGDGWPVVRAADHARPPAGGGGEGR
jgi:ethanolamine utilization protein EutA (predicted chaperonin)